MQRKSHKYNDLGDFSSAKRPWSGPFFIEKRPNSLHEFSQRAFALPEPVKSARSLNSAPLSDCLKSAITLFSKGSSLLGVGR